MGGWMDSWNVLCRNKSSLSTLYLFGIIHIFKIRTKKCSTLDVVGRRWLVLSGSVGRPWLRWSCLWVLFTNERKWSITLTGSSTQRPQGCCAGLFRRGEEEKAKLSISQSICVTPLTSGQELSALTEGLPKQESKISFTPQGGWVRP